MATGKRSFNFLILWALIVFSGFLLSCGGGGGSGSTAVSSSSQGTGSAALLLADGPADDYAHLWIAILEVTLLPADGSGLSPVTIFRSTDPDGYLFDLLDLRDQDFLLTVKDNIPSGTYSKIRLRIVPDSIDAVSKEGVTAACDDLQIKLPSGKIDLNPQGGIPIRAGETLAIRLDIDANKSIQLHAAGNSGKCIFRPVVFVDIEPVFVPNRCPRIISGSVGGLYTDGDGTIGFELLFSDSGRAPLDVWLIDADIFDENLNMATPADLSEGQPVSVRGRLDAEGDLQASLVIIGLVDRVKGTVETTVVDRQFSINDFLIDPEPDPPVEAETLTIGLVDGAVVYRGCDTPVTPEFIEVGMGTRMLGQWDPDNELFRAVAVFVTPKIITGTISAYDTTMKTITLAPSGTEVAVPDTVKPFLVGDGQVPWAYIFDRADCGNGVQAQVYLDPERDAPTALKLLIPPETFTDDDAPAAVTQIYPISGIIEVQGGRQIHVETGATILLSDGDSEEPISLGALDLLDNVEVRSYGLSPCPAGVLDDFYGFIVIASIFTE